MADLDTQRQELASTLATLKSQAEGNGVSVTRLSAAIDDIGDKLRTLGDDIASTKVPTAGPLDESAAYVLSEADYEAYGQRNPSVAKTDRGAVQMTVTERSAVMSGDRVTYSSFGLLDDPNPRSDWQRELQQAAQTRSIVRNLIRGGRTPRLDSELADTMRAGPGMVRNIFADSSGIGGEWIPDTTLAELERDVMAQSNFSSLFAQRDVGPGGSLKIPYKTGFLRVYKHAVPTTDNPADDVLSNWTTEDRTVDPIAFAVAVQADRDATEDSIIAIVPEITSDISDAFSFASDDIWTNGDTAATHQDAIAAWDPRGRLGGTAGLGASNDHRRGWLGLRAYAADGSATIDQGAAQTATGLLAAITTMDMEHLVDANGVSRVTIAVSPEYFFKTMLLWSEFQTWDKVGPNASLLTGSVGIPGSLLPNQVGFLWGRFPVVLNYALAPDMNASGVFDNVTETKTGLLIVDRSRFQTWQRKGLTIETDTEIRNNTQVWVARRRVVGRAVSGTPSSARKDVIYSYNLTS